MQGQLSRVVAEGAGLPGQFGAGIDGDVAPGPDLFDQARHLVGAGGVVGEGRTEPSDPAAQPRRPLDDDGLDAEVGQADRCTQSRDAAADNQRLGHRLDPQGFQRIRESGLRDAGPNQPDRLLGGTGTVVRVGPRVLLADVHLGVGVLVEVGTFGDVAKGDLVQFRRARRDHQPVEVLAADVVDHVVLGAVRAGEHRRLRDDDTGLVLERLADGLHVHVVGDVSSAVADVHADPALGRVRCGPVLPGEGRIQRIRRGHTVTSWVKWWCSRWAATCATAAPECRMVSTMSFAPEAVPATNTPGTVVWPGLSSALGSAT